MPITGYNQSLVDLAAISGISDLSIPSAVSSLSAVTAGLRLQLAEYQRRRSAKPKKPEQQKREPKSCFTEADFEKFEREHFVGQKKKLPPRADNL